MGAEYYTELGPSKKLLFLRDCSTQNLNPRTPKSRGYSTGLEDPRAAKDSHLLSTSELAALRLAQFVHNNAEIHTTKATKAAEAHQSPRQIQKIPTLVESTFDEQGLQAARQGNVL